MNHAGQTTTASVKAAPQTAAEALAGRLATINEVLGNHVSRLHDAVTRAIGSDPEKQQGGNPRAVPNGVIGTVNEKIDDLLGLCDALSDQLNRLDTII